MDSDPLGGIGRKIADEFKRYVGSDDPAYIGAVGDDLTSKIYHSHTDAIRMFLLEARDTAFARMEGADGDEFDKQTLIFKRAGEALDILESTGNLYTVFEEMLCSKEVLKNDQLAFEKYCDDAGEELDRLPTTI